MRHTNSVLLCWALVTVAAGAIPAHGAIINVANLKPVIGGNSDYFSGDFNTGGSFATLNVTNGVNASPDNNTGTITESFNDTSYWLGRQGQSTGYFVLDLLAPYSIGDFEIFNTSNGSAQDRGTGQFTIKASNSVVNLGGTLGFDLSGSIVTLASGTLLTQAYTNPVPLLAQDFTSSDIVTKYRYIRFDALSFSAPYTQGVGLNELRIFEAPPVPEPSTLTLAGLGIAGLAIRSRRRRLSRQAA